MLVKWNSTYLMLQSAIDYSTEIIGYYNMEMALVGSPSLSEDNWYVANIFLLNS